VVGDRRKAKIQIKKDDGGREKGGGGGGIGKRRQRLRYQWLVTGPLDLKEISSDSG